MSVDEILASGRYTDRRGRGWDYIEGTDAWCTAAIDHEGIQWGSHWMEPDQIRVLIERDQHRDECIGLDHCDDHPAVSVVQNRKTGFWLVFDVHGWTECIGPEHRCWENAMSAARALAVGE